MRVPWALSLIERSKMLDSAEEAQKKANEEARGRGGTRDIESREEANLHEDDDLEQRHEEIDEDDVFGDGGDLEDEEDDDDL
ncbi:uncharacterized protein SPPG_08751 [Spizellomyces punctatus DAOM BR117]|uniref:Uncharacterized protein n=1 Tax=Spizellomyces punctatus (strain DAOM BR117) TaxID=645134 RepID=A0A0L0H579_SPIPD|nr:uncharacterized protein SPPG_08751 [Spizellomyces punctatus DAOM BR117]KNC95888.1 hypothetical protein SPPG_08751 [Spizellomyces punctatus DAOM BR117]|eukprot:XP_016603928.1 hypothetical protein SPPG_08751 [Spizellomyces punctatus DAOM BR117]